MKNAIAIVGPTASGKTGLAIDVALALDTEIVSADSMQFYRGMEIGTGQPTPGQLARVKHHFIAHLAPDEYMSAADYAAAARAVVARLNAAGKPAVVVGGSGLYIRALIDGLFEGPGRSCDIRARLHARAQSEKTEVGESQAGGIPALYAELQRVDPDYAARVEPGDLRRIVRALEVFELTGRPLSALHAEQQAQARALAARKPAGEDAGATEATNISPESESARKTGKFPPESDNEPETPNPSPAQPLDTLQVALEWPRDELYKRIDARVLAMFGAGLLDEVQRLLDEGYEPQLNRLKTLAYRECIAHLRGQLPLDQTIATIQQNTRRYAKRQLSWFRGDERVRWVDAQEAVSLTHIIDTISDVQK